MNMLSSKLLQCSLFLLFLTIYVESFSYSLITKPNTIVLCPPKERKPCPHGAYNGICGITCYRGINETCKVPNNPWLQECVSGAFCCNNRVDRIHRCVTPDTQEICVNELPQISKKWYG